MNHLATTALAGLLLGVSGPWASANGNGLLINKSGHDMKVKPMVDAVGKSLFSLTPLDVDGVRPRGATIVGSAALLDLDMLPVKGPLPSPGSLMFRSDHAKGSLAELSFWVTGPKSGRVPLFQFRVLFACDKTGAVTRATLKVHESASKIEQLPFDVVTSAQEPHKLVLLPKGEGAQAPAGEESKAPAEPSQIEVGISDAPAEEAAAGSAVEGDPAACSCVIM